MDIQTIKQRFGIIGTSDQLNRCIDVARQVAPTEMSVLITGESGVGKEVFSHIIHQLSSRKHGTFIAVNCGAIPEGTIDSELFGHEKGSFTGASEARKGYFEVVDGGTIFLDEVAELPTETQARLLRVLESGEYIRVGSSKVQKTNVRVIAATNVRLIDAVEKGKFREDLYYRLNTVPINIPPLRERVQDIHILFRKFVNDFSEKNKIPMIALDESAVQVLESYRWPGNIRQLKNIAEQITILEKNRSITGSIVAQYIPKENPQNLPTLFGKENKEQLSERDLLYKVLFDMKKDVNDLKRVVLDLLQTNRSDIQISDTNADLVEKIYQEMEPSKRSSNLPPVSINATNFDFEAAPLEKHEEVEETLSLHDHEKDLIIKALEKNRGKRKNAARELGISERTLYRKIKEYDL